MLVSSKLFPEGTKSGTTHTLVIRYGPRHVLVLLPQTFPELLSITRVVFGSSPDSSFVFETSDLNICQDASVEIHPAAWEAIAFTVSTVVVKNKDLVSPRGEEDAEVPLRPQVGRKTSIPPRRAHKTASGSSNEVIRSENSAGVTSYDDIADALPTDDLAEEELGSYDDDNIDVALAQRKGKGKARVRIESEDEAEDGDEEGRAEALPVAKLPASYRLRNAVEPSFSIVPSSSTPKRVATPPRTLWGAGARGLLSPAKVRSSLAESFPPPAPSDEEGDVKPPSYKSAQVASDEFPHPGKTPPNAPPLKETQNDDSAAPTKFKPQFTANVAPALAPVSASLNDKLLITIRHPPTEKENKFKVKATHTVGRVLSSACVAFGLNPNGASLMHWSEEDGIETSYRCGNDLSMSSTAVDGTIFIIELAK